MLSGIFLLPCSVFANFDFNANCLNAYRSIFELKLGNAKAYISTEKRQHPNNSIIPFLENYVDFFTLLTSENKADFDRLKDNKSKRLDQISDDDEKSPYYLYTQAEINLQWALIRGRFGEYFTAALEVKRANLFLQQNQKKFPNFHLNSKGLALINAVLGNLPDGALKSALSTFGIRGDLQTGLNMFEKLADNLPKSSFEPFYEETVFYYAYVLTDVAHSSQAYAKTMKYTAKIDDNSLLKSYLQAYVCIKNSHSDEAISILAKRPSGDLYQRFPYLDYLSGIAYLNKLDLNNASLAFNRFLQNTKGANFIKDAYLHQAWIALLKGDKANYNSFAAKAINNGYTFMDKDKQANNEASAAAPNAELLKARLLFDGGYLQKALLVLDGKKAADFANERDKLEFSYRQGRIYDDLGKDELALQAYQNTINQGRKTKYYYAANAAVQMGKIYEKEKNAAKAKEAFKNAISMKNHEYESSIENQAKAGLKRIWR